MSSIENIKSDFPRNPAPENSFSAMLRSKIAPILLGAIGGAFVPLVSSNKEEAQATMQSEIEQRVKQEVSERVASYAKDHENELIGAAVQALLRRKDLDQGLKQHMDGLVGDWHSNVDQMKRDMLDPVVRLTTPFSEGSGVIVYAEENQTNCTTETYILTNWHVVSEEVDFNSFRFLGNAVVSAIPVPVTAEIFQGTRMPQPVPFEVVFFDEQRDLALIKGVTNGSVEVAKLAKGDEFAALQPFDLVFAVGCPIGNAPMPTMGILSDMQYDGSSGDYLLASSPVTHGNSGGGLFLAYDRKLIGIVTAIAAEIGPTGITELPHMGFAIPAYDIEKFLLQAGFVVRDDGALQRWPLLEISASIVPPEIYAAAETK